MTRDMGLPEMVEGYLDGFSDDEEVLPNRLSNRGARYCHGWLNGRDDRIGKPRASAAHLRILADLAESQDQAFLQ